jgi:sterol desaturase/sphingolipid hydroxylase (fatty acid hydroxylase superfamily)
VFFQYYQWLALLSLTFVVLERLRPWRPQPLWRPRILQDLFYIVWNGHYLGVVLALLTVHPALFVERGVARLGIGTGWVSAWPAWLQFLVAFVVLDLMQWSIHNLLHRLPWLWRFHQIHHSIQVMDFWGSMRFHWMEIVVYKSLQFLPLLLLGFRGDVLLLQAIIATAIGHFNHSNLDVDLGPLHRLINGPRFHIWHHDRAFAGKGTNFAINLTVWDWLFGTAEMPPGQPERLGYPGDERFNWSLPAQFIHPLVERRP